VAHHAHLVIPQIAMTAMIQMRMQSQGRQVIMMLIGVMAHMTIIVMEAKKSQRTTAQMLIRVVYQVHVLGVVVLEADSAYGDVD